MWKATMVRESQKRLKSMLKDTITLLCKNGLEFKDNFTVEATIGVTIDDDEVLLLSLNELIKADKDSSDESSYVEISIEEERTRRKRKRGSQKLRPYHGSSQDDNPESSYSTQTSQQIYNKSPLRKRSRPDISTIKEHDHSYDVALVKEENNASYSTQDSSLVWDSHVPDLSNTVEPGDQKVVQVHDADGLSYIVTSETDSQWLQADAAANDTDNQNNSNLVSAALSTLPDGIANGRYQGYMGSPLRSSSRLGSVDFDYIDQSPSAHPLPISYWRQRPDYKQWNQDDLDKAINAVMSGEMSSPAAAKEFNIPNSTLKRKILKQVSLAKSPQTNNAQKDYSQTESIDLEHTEAQ